METLQTAHKFVSSMSYGYLSMCFIEKNSLGNLLVKAIFEFVLLSLHFLQAKVISHKQKFADTLLKVSKFRNQIVLSPKKPTKVFTFFALGSKKS